MFSSAIDWDNSSSDSGLCSACAISDTQLRSLSHIPVILNAHSHSLKLTVSVTLDLDLSLSCARASINTIHFSSVRALSNITRPTRH